MTGEKYLIRVRFCFQQLRLLNHFISIFFVPKTNEASATRSSCNRIQRNPCISKRAERPESNCQNQGENIINCCYIESLSTHMVRSSSSVAAKGTFRMKRVFPVSGPGSRGF